MSQRPPKRPLTQSPIATIARIAAPAMMPTKMEYSTMAAPFSSSSNCLAILMSFPIRILLLPDLTNQFQAQDCDHSLTCNKLSGTDPDTLNADAEFTSG